MCYYIDLREISIHAPRTGSDERVKQRTRGTRTFQSTLPARGATAQNADVIHLLTISIHAPRTGSDLTVDTISGWSERFQSTLPARGATHCESTLPIIGVDFNPRSPHGERLYLWQEVTAENRFQSTLPARGATLDEIKTILLAEFQSTLPARGATVCFLPTTESSWYFNPRSPHGERRCRRQRGVCRRRISIHAPRTGSDAVANAEWVKHDVISIHAPRTGSDVCQND